MEAVHPEVQKMIIGFGEQLLVDMQAARQSGLVPEDTTEVELARACFAATADKYRPLSKRNKDLARRLRATAVI